MNYKWDERIALHVNDRIDSDQAQRQERTAQDILKRFHERPGIVLADEVGMGKTFVALGVAASVALADPRRRPVVVMTPPSLKEKWPSDFAVFQERCLRGGSGTELRCARADRAVDFLRLLDDPPETRARVIFLTHGAMSRSMDDKWVMLAIVHQATKNRRGVEDIRGNIAKHAGELLQMGWIDKSAPGVWESLLKTSPRDWRRILQRHRIGLTGPNTEPEDDPVPEAIWDALPGLNTDELYEAIQRLPRRKTTHYKERIRDARTQLKTEMRSLWDTALKRLDVRLPLLILDEAHHLKNSQTKLASLFQTEASSGDADELSRGVLTGAFERMLFLTATPFQLGHGELCRVLDRFEAVDWVSSASPAMGRTAFRAAVDDLKSALNDAQECAMGLDRSWGRLRPDDLRLADGPRESSEEWWAALAQAEETDLSPNACQVVLNYRRAMSSMRRAESLLRPWVLRHLKPRTMPTQFGQVPRRSKFAGDAILDDSILNRGEGLQLANESMLPFLLAARAAAQSQEQRPVFAEGLASSYEAFLHTRARNAQGVEAILDEDSSDSAHVNEASEWYLKCLEELIPRDSPSGSRSHPKVDATVNKAIKLWRAGEKVLIFCHYVATGRTLRRHISDALACEIEQIGSERLGCAPGEVGERLERVGNRFFDSDSPIRRACDQELGAILRDYPALRNCADTLLEVARRNIRTPSFLVRFFPLDSPAMDGSTMVEALNRQDASGLSLRELLHRAFQFLAKRTEEERNRYIDAVSRIQTGSHLGADIGATFSEDEYLGDRTEQLLPNVRLVNGTTKSETRQRLMLTFNTPFYPEILIASSVMAEGVDLHLNCRHIIHHDLCWNPSTLEQRTGRVDRIGAKAEHCGRPIHVYVPFIAETQDEKMYRVVTDRERWFNVVMGEEYCLEAHATDRLAERIPLPIAVAESLAFDLTARDCNPI